MLEIMMNHLFPLYLLVAAVVVAVILFHLAHLAPCSNCQYYYYHCFQFALSLRDASKMQLMRMLLPEFQIPVMEM